jgi:hypothetical protein
MEQLADWRKGPRVEISPVAACRVESAGLTARGGRWAQNILIINLFSSDNMQSQGQGVNDNISALPSEAIIPVEQRSIAQSESNLTTLVHHIICRQTLNPRQYSCVYTE